MQKQEKRPGGGICLLLPVDRVHGTQVRAIQRVRVARARVRPAVVPDPRAVDALGHSAVPPANKRHRSAARHGRKVGRRRLKEGGAQRLLFFFSLERPLPSGRFEDDHAFTRIPSPFGQACACACACACAELVDTRMQQHCSKLRGAFLRHFRQRGGYKRTASAQHQPKLR